MWTGLRQLWNDETGAIVSAEMAMFGSLAAVGVGVGVHEWKGSLESEIEETAQAIRRLDQSYEFSGQACDGAWTAGSRFVQPDPNDSP